MKLKNIAIGDFVQVKKSICRIEFEAEELCEVIDIDRVYKQGFDVLIQGKSGLYWVNHKNLKKPIKREPEPQLKQLDQSVFKGSPDWAVSAAISPNGKAYVYSVTGDGFYGISDKHGYQIKGGDRANCIGDNYDTSNWQNSLIERDIAKEPLEVDFSSELTGSDLCHEMLKRGDKAVMCKINESNSMTIIIDYKESRLGGWVFHSHRHSNHYIVTPINNQGEPLTASEVGL